MCQHDSQTCEVFLKFLRYLLLYDYYRDNSTRNLCNILKDTFERSAEKMHLCKCLFGQLTCSKICVDD